jgi:hypothetical protein
VFVASTLSDLNKRQLDDYGVHWTELQRRNGFVRFSKTLAVLGIPHRSLPSDEDHTERIAEAVGDYLVSVE